MRKLFLKFSVLLFVLGMSISSAWANDAAINYIMTSKDYCAQLTGHVYPVGSGTVYVTTDGNLSPFDESYEGEKSNVGLTGLGASFQGMDELRVAFYAWSEPNDGYYFAGWSTSEGGVDLGKDQPYAKLYDVATVKNETVYYDIYATFEPIRIADYTITGSNTITEGTSCTQTVTFTLNGEDIDADDFFAPAITSTTGGGSWTNASGAALSISDLSISGTTATVVVKFTAPNANVAEYTANLQLKTKNNLTMNVPLGARIIAEGVEAIRLNKSKVQYEEDEGKGTLESMLSKAIADDIIKLNGNYDNAVSINKNITFDLNGYTLNNTLTISGGSVTLAYSRYGGSATALSVTGGKAIVNGGTFGSLTIGASGTVEQNGATIMGTATNNGTLTTLDGKFHGVLTSTGTLIVNGGIFNNESGVAITVTGGTAQIKKGTITGSAYGVQSAGSTTIEKLAVISGTTKALKITAGKTTVKCGKFLDPDKLVDIIGGTLDFQSAYFLENVENLTSVQGKSLWRNTSGAEFREGYHLFAGSADEAKAAGVSVCHIGTVSYVSLEDALAFANNTTSNVTIIMDNDYTLPAGYYTLPANAVLIIPKSNEQTEECKTIESVRRTDPLDPTLAWLKPSKFRCLTLADGVNLDVHGTIEVGGSQYSTSQSYSGCVYGPYGQIQMNKGSKMVLQSGSELRAWGFITGDIAHQDAQHNVPMGEIDARRNSKVREQFQMGDWKGAYFSGMGLLTGNTVFPLKTYFIQNIEVPVKYHPGAKLSTTTTVTADSEEFAAHGMDLNGMAITMSAKDISIIGVNGIDEAMFLMENEADAENTWVRKWYDASKDQQVYEINSGAHIGNLIIPLVSSPVLPQFHSKFPEDLTMNSGQYLLPITNNFKLHVLSGSMDFTQSTELLPGCEVEIDKEANVQITVTEGIKSGSLYLYDWQDWGLYAGGAYGRKVKYTPVFDGEVPDAVRDVTDCSKMGSASIDVRGSFATNGGFVFTTEHGANIYSSLEEAGTFNFTENAAKDEGYTENIPQVTGQYGNGQASTLCYPAYLRNSDEYIANGGDAFIPTAGAEEETSFCFMDIDGTGGQWANLEQEDCFVKNGGTYYAKPQEYVALSSNEPNAVTHTYSDLNGAGRLFILIEDGGVCQWWEVEAKDNYFHCIHPENDTYYEWNGSKWVEKRFTITWKDWDGSTITTYSVPYGTQAEWLSSNPTREKTIDYTYNFTGWTPALSKVTSDVTYTATYEEEQIKYTIIFVKDGGVEIERHLLAHNEQPVCENVPTRTGYILQWDPALAAVTGNQTYTATWLPDPPSEFEIRFVDYDGTSELQKGNVAVGEMPEYEGDTPTGKATWAESEGNKEFTYVFDHWSPALAEVDQALTYTAVYREVAKEYTIKFVKEGGDPDTPADVIESHQYQYGETPVCSNLPTKAATVQNTYKLRWTPQIQTVVDDANYTAVFDATTNKYTVSVKSNPSGACSISGAGIYDYNTSETAVTISLTTNSGYTFAGWSDNQGGTNTTRQMAVTGDINLVANFTVAEPDYTITWKNEDGSANLVAPVGQKAGTATTYTGPTPTKAADAQFTYTFDGWTTSPNGAGSFYKNNQTPKATADATYYAHFAAKEEIMEIGIGQAQNITEATTVNQLIINSNGTVSGQLTGNVNNLNVTGACYYDLTGTFTAGKWFAVAVPWQVTAGDIKADGNTLSWNSGNYLAYYDGSVRAAQGKVDACWKYVSNGTVLEPGRLYMLYLQNNASKLRFPKKADADILTTSTAISAHAAAEATDANWNGIANPAIFYAYLGNTGATVGQVFNADAQSYTAVSLGNKLIVAKPIFVQATNNGSATATLTPPASAPARRNVATETQKAEYQVEIAAYGKMQDRLFIQTDDEKEADTYTLGQDVLKFGISNTVAQMWVDRYDAKLCMNTMAPVNSVAEFPLSIYVPRTGEYTIAIENEKATADHTLYLTYNGEVIWSLSDGVYTANIQKGTDTNYGLRVIAKAPQTATGVDDAIVDSKDATAAKVLIGNQVFIIRGEKVYSVDGRLIK